MKQKSSMGYLRLIIAIVIICVVVVFGFNYVKKMIDNEQNKNFQADLLLIQAEVELIKGKHEMDKENNQLKGYQLTQLPENINLDEFYGKNIISAEEYEKYYLFDSVVLEQSGLGDISNKYNGYFLVNYDSYEIIYTEGYENENGLWCYKISDLNKKPEHINQKMLETANRAEENQDNIEENAELQDNADKQEDTSGQENSANNEGQENTNKESENQENNNQENANNENQENINEENANNGEENTVDEERNESYFGVKEKMKSTLEGIKNIENAEEN